MKKTVRQLLDCVELDPSMYIRIQVRMWHSDAAHLEVLA